MKKWTFISGLKRVKLMAELLTVFIMLLFLSIFSFSVMADDKQEKPSTELLEFLGEWETEQGEWFDPFWILKNIRSKTDDKKEKDDE